MMMFQSASVLTFVYIGVLALGLIMVFLSWLALTRSFTAGSQSQTAAGSGRSLAQAAALSLGVAALVFGAAGLLAESVFAVTPESSVLWSLAAGLVAGFITQITITRQLGRQTTREQAAGDKLAGREAEVVIPIPADGLGEIVVVAGKGQIHWGASSSSGKPIERGARVIIDRVSQNVAIVRPAGEPTQD